MWRTASPVDPRPRRADRILLWAGLGGALLVLSPTLSAGAATLPGAAPELEALVRVPEVAIDAAELARYRGGFFTPGGLEISFGLRFELDIDDKLRLVTRFTPRNGPGKGKWSWADFETGAFELVYKDKGGADPLAELRRNADGLVEGAGVKQVEDLPNGKLYEFEGGVAAKLIETKNGFKLATTGDLPVEVKKGKKGVEIKAGDETTTFVQNHINAEQFLARLANRQDGASIRQDAILDLNVLNYSDVAAATRTVTQARRLQNLVNLGVVQFGVRY